MNPLVSVIVITYNSSKYILDGLKSLEDQTYDNIEVIISDDCSTDNTVEICKEWINNSRNKFKRIQLIEASQNTGVAGNLNRGIMASKGDWIKTLSGDDQFLSTSIERYVHYVINNPNVNICFAKFKFTGEENTSFKLTKAIYEKIFYRRINLPPKKQYIENLKQMSIPGPGLFYSRKLYDNIKGYDEEYQFCEEDPFTLKVFDSGEYVHFINEKLYIYRIDDNSLGRKDNHHTALTRHLRDRIRFFYDIRKDRLKKEHLYFNIFEEELQCKRYFANLSKNILYKVVLKIATYFSPMHYKQYFITKSIHKQIYEQP